MKKNYNKDQFIQGLSKLENNFKLQEHQREAYIINYIFTNYINNEFLDSITDEEIEQSINIFLECVNDSEEITIETYGNNKESNIVKEQVIIENFITVLLEVKSQPKKESIYFF